MLQKYEGKNHSCLALGLCKMWQFSDSSLEEWLPNLVTSGSPVRKFKVQLSRFHARGVPWHVYFTKYRKQF